MKKRLNVFLLTVFMFLSSVAAGTPALASTNGITRDQAVAYLNSLPGTGHDVDGNGVWCTDIAKMYYSYLGQGGYAYGNGKDYINRVPPGWRALPQGTQPEPGDVAVYTYGGVVNGVVCGHVFVIESADSVGNNGIHQNYGGVSTCQKVWTRNSAISGLVRPDFAAPAPSDTTAPSITDVKVTDVSSKGYNVTCTVNDDSGNINEVLMPTWTDVNGQDDIQWHGCKGHGNGVYTCYISTDVHGNQTGAYTTHVYATDAAGNKAGPVGLNIDVPKPDNEKPVISDVKVTNVTTEGYTVSCTATDNVGVTRVEFPTWTLKQTNGNEQDDLQSPWPQGTKSGNTYTFNVKISDHNNERGAYRTHIYAFDADGNSTSTAVDDVTIPDPETQKKLKLSDFKIVSQSSTQFTVQARWKLDSSSVKIVKSYFEVTKSVDGKDVMKAFDAESSGNGLYTATIPISAFGNEIGSYSIMTDVTLSDGIEYESVTPITVTIKSEDEKESLTVRVSASPSEGGTVSGSGEFKQGESVVVTAQANSGYRFVGWYNGSQQVTTNSTYSFYISNNTHLTARFEEESNTTNTTSSGETEIYRVYNRISGEHLYTVSQDEVRALTNGDWNYEGVGWNAPNSGTAVYRLYNPALADHLYTTDENEVRELTSNHGWQLDFGGEPIFYSDGSKPIYRLYNPESGRHHLTTDEFEYSVLPSHGWSQEGRKLSCLS